MIRPLMSRWTRLLAQLRGESHPDPYPPQSLAAADPAETDPPTASSLSTPARRGRRWWGFGAERSEAADDVLVADASDPSLEPLSEELRARLNAGLARLDERDREFLLLHRLKGLSYQTIADRHGVEIDDVQRHIARATARLACEPGLWQAR